MAMRDWVKNDWIWKLFSLVLAVAIWVTVRTLSTNTAPDANPLGVWDTHTYTNVPVIVFSTAADAREFKVNPNTVRVTVSGRPEIMTALQPKEIHATVDLTDIEAARDLRKRVEISTPPGVTFIRVAPPEVDVVVPPKRNR